MSDILFIIMKKRGLVIYPSIDVTRNEFLEKRHPFDDENKIAHIEYHDIDATILRLYVLYWDILDYPKNNLISGLVSHISQFSGDYKILAAEGVLRQTEIRYEKEAFDARLPYVDQAATLIHNNKNRDEIWSLGQNHKHIVLPDEYAVRGNSIELELYQSIPVPNEDVPIEEVLEFRQKRNAELQRFRHKMDELYLDVVQSADILRTKTYAVDEIQRALIDLNRVFREKKFLIKRPTLKVELNITDLVIKGILGGNVSTQFGLPPEIGSMVGLAASLIKVGVGPIDTVKGLPEHLKDYAYLAYIEKDIKKKRRRRKRK